MAKRYLLEYQAYGQSGHIFANIETSGTVVHVAVDGITQATLLFRMK